MIYQERLLLYVDVLGWSHAIRNGQPTSLLAAVKKFTRTRTVTVKMLAKNS